MNKTRTTHKARFKIYVGKFLVKSSFDGAKKFWNRQKIRMTEESKDYFRKGPLKYEIDLYEYAKAIFYQKRKRMLGR